MSFLLDILSGILANIISGKILMISKKRSQKSSNTQKHRELQLTVFLGFQAAVPSRVMRKLVCRLWLNEVSQQ